MMTHEPQPQPQRRRISACHRHPTEPLTGICASCLRERLSGFDPAVGCGIPTSTTCFKNSGVGGASVSGKRNGGTSATFPPELRRSKSLSAGKCEGYVEPFRRSCDVRVRHTLWYLFNLDDEKNGMDGGEIRTNNLGYSGVKGTVLESREEYENEEEIRVSEGAVVLEENEGIEEIEGEVETKTMKEHIDLEWQSMKHDGRDLKDMAGSFWVAASVFSKKLRKWQQRQKMRKIRKTGGDGSSSSTMQVEKPLGIGRHLRDTQSEIGDYGFGRRFCDTDPRLSIDAGRMSLDIPRHSFDESRASWDGHLIGRPLPRLPQKLTVVKNRTLSIQGLGNQVLIEEQMNDVNENGRTPDQDRWQRRDFDRCSSERKMNPVEIDESKNGLNEGMSELFHQTKSLNSGGDSRDSNSNSAQDDCSGGFDSASRDSSSSTINGGIGKQFKFKNSHKWRKAWNVWSSVRRHNDKNCGDEEMCCYRGNVVDDALVESSEKQATEYRREAERGVNGVLLRSKSCVGSRNSCEIAGTFHNISSFGGGSHERKGFGKKRRESVLERNQMPRHSPTNHDGGLLRFYLTPLRSYRRRSQKHRLKSSRSSILRSILRLY